jgi:hypothetical protein
MVFARRMEAASFFAIKSKKDIADSLFAIFLWQLAQINALLTKIL